MEKESTKFSTITRLRYTKRNTVNKLQRSQTLTKGRTKERKWYESEMGPKPWETSGKLELWGPSRPLTAREIFYGRAGTGIVIELLHESRLIMRCVVLYT